MHRLFLGCNLWSALFMTAAAFSGWAGSASHVRVAVFAAIFSCLVQSGVIALFLGASKLIKEHVGRYSMPMALIDRLNEVYHKLIPMAAVGSSLAAAASIVGGLAHLNRVPMWAHVTLATAAYLYLLAIIPLEYRLQRRLHDVVTDVETLLPAAGGGPGTGPMPGFRPDQVVFDRMGRAKALLYVGMTLPLPYLGYTFISGQDVSYLMLPTIFLTAGCLGWAAREYRAARPDHHG
ncbi:MAG TPA: hypothetical protein VGK94_03115 [Candidatus Polarisedimenticolia bacterium]|jgi:hypothetical protein